MARPIRRRRRPPVLSRLTLAWVCAGALACSALAGVAFLAIEGRKGERIFLPVQEIETVARADAPAVPDAPPTLGGLKLSAPGQRDADGEPLGAPARINPGPESEVPEADVFDDENFTDGDPEGLATPEFSADDVVITIAGADAPPRATPVSRASLSRRREAPAVPEPDPALLRATAFGEAPRIAPDGRAAMNLYRSPDAGGRGKKIALIVGGLGLNAAVTEQAIDELPPEISLAFAPYAKDLQFWAAKARRAGHEVLIELPMEGYGAEPRALGEAALLTSRSPEENAQRLDWLLSRFQGYFAATNYLGGKFSAQKNAIEPVLDSLARAGVAYYDDTGAAQLTAAGAAPHVVTVNRVIPGAGDEAARSAFRRDLRALERLAEQNGEAVGKTFAYAAGIEEIAAWARGLEDDGFRAAPASAILPKRAPAR